MKKIRSYRVCVELAENTRARIQWRTLTFDSRRKALSYYHDVIRFLSGSGGCVAHSTFEFADVVLSVLYVDGSCQDFISDSFKL